MAGHHVAGARVGEEEDKKVRYGSGELLGTLEVTKCDVFKYGRAM